MSRLLLKNHEVEGGLLLVDEDLAIDRLILLHIDQVPLQVMQTLKLLLLYNQPVQFVIDLHYLFFGRRHDVSILF